MRHKLFDFLDDEYYKLMLDMSKEMHDKSEQQTISNRFQTFDQKKFFAICHEHELDGVVGCYAKSIGLELPDYWEKEFEKQSRRQEFFKEKAKDICESMDAAGIPMVLLKNGGIMSALIPQAVKCPMEDIDSLIRKKDFFKAHGILLEKGFQLKFRSEFEKDEIGDAYRHGSAEYFLPMPGEKEMWFELSWRSVDGRWIRPDMEPDTDDFIARSFMPEGTKVHVLSPEDNLLQVSIHTAKHSYCRAPGLRLHMDVDRIVAHETIDWERFLAIAKNIHVKTSTYFSLLIPSVIFGTQVPQWVLDELKPKQADKILNMLSRAGLTHPKGKKFSKLQFLMFQTALYDTKKDMLKVLYPGKQWMNEHYGCKNSFDRAFSAIKRGLDLVGIRKKAG